MEDDYIVPDKRNKSKNKRRSPYKRGGHNRLNNKIIENEKTL